MQWFCQSLKRGFALALACACVSSCAAAPYTLRNQWSTVIGSHSDSSPAIAPDGTIYVGTFDGKLWALRADGTRKWIFRSGSEIKSSPAIGADGTVYFGSRDRRLHAISAEGAEKWSFKTDAWVDSSPALASDGTIHFGSWDRIFYALDRNGSKKWEFRTGGEIVSSPAIGKDGTVYFGSHDRKFYALYPNGDRRWTFVTSGPILSSPAINGDESVYFTSVDGFLYALNLDGSLRWRMKTGGITESSPVVGTGGRIFLGVNLALWAISPGGQKLWARLNEEPVDATPVALADGSVCYASRRGLLLDLDDAGEPLWTFYLEGYGYACPAVGPDGTVFAADRGVLFSAFKSNVLLAKTPWPRFRGNPANTGNLSTGNSTGRVP